MEGFRSRSVLMLTNNHAVHYYLRLDAFRSSNMTANKPMNNQSNYLKPFKIAIMTQLQVNSPPSVSYILNRIV